MSKENSSWLRETSQFCRSTGIKIMASGPGVVIVKAKSPGRAKEIASQLARLGFNVVDQKDDCLRWNVEPVPGSCT